MKKYLINKNKLAQNANKIEGISYKIVLILSFFCSFYQAWDLQINNSNLVEKTLIILIYTMCIGTIFSMIIGFVCFLSVAFFYEKMLVKYPNQIVENDGIEFPEWCSKLIFDVFYDAQRYQDLARIQSKFKQSIINDVEFNKVMFLFKNFKFNIRRYSPKNYLMDEVKVHVFKILAEKENFYEYKELVSSSMFDEFCLKRKTGDFSSEMLSEAILPLKSKDLPFGLVDELNGVNLNYLTYLLIIPNRKTMTIDSLRKVVGFYPQIYPDQDIIKYFRSREVFLPYSEKRIVKLLQSGLNGSKLLDLARLQMEGIDLQYPEKPESFDDLLHYISVNNFLAFSFLNNYSNAEYVTWNPYEKIPKLVNLHEQKYHGYIFKVMKTSFELSELGNILNICVGSYPAKGLIGKYQILAILKDNNPVYCVSIDCEFKKINEIKGKNNMIVFEKKLVEYINSQLLD